MCPEDPVPELIAREMERGVRGVDAVSAATLNAGYWWKVVGVCVVIARRTGAPLGPSLTSLAGALEDAQSTHRDIQSALVGPRQTIRLVSLLPLLALIGGALGGVEHTLMVWTTAPGWGILGVAGVLIAGALWWLRLLREAAVPVDEDASVELDIFAEATKAGLLPERAWHSVAEEFEKAQLTLRHSEEVDHLVALSRRAGVPVSGLAKARSASLREQSRHEAQARVDTMEVRLALPLGLLVLPAFVLVSVAPVLLGVVRAGGI